MLTDQEIDNLCSEWLYVAPGRTYEEHRPFARAIESAATAPLLARIAELEVDCDRLERYWNEAMATHKNIAELEQQLAEARKDAERYRRLRDGRNWPAVFASHDAPEPLRGEDLDAAIRARGMRCDNAS